MWILFFIRYSLALVYAKTAVCVSVGLISRGLAKTDPVRIPDQALEELVDKNLSDDEILAKAAKNEESLENEIARSWLIDDSELEEDSLSGSDKGPVYENIKKLFCSSICEVSALKLDPNKIHLFFLIMPKHFGINEEMTLYFTEGRYKVQQGGVYKISEK